MFVENFDLKNRLKNEIVEINREYAVDSANQFIKKSALGIHRDHRAVKMKVIFFSTLISSCCLNAFKFPDLTKRCPTGSSAALVDGDTGYDSKITGISASNDETQTRCTNNANAPEESRKFNYLRGSRNFYRYSHRGCPLGANNHTDCGDESELTQFRLDFKFSTSLLYKTLT